MVHPAAFYEQLQSILDASQDLSSATAQKLTELGTKISIYVGNVNQEDLDRVCVLAKEKACQLSDEVKERLSWLDDLCLKKIEQGVRIPVMEDSDEEWVQV